MKAPTLIVRVRGDLTAPIDEVTRQLLSHSPSPLRRIPGPD
jgi:hypothetical protein